MYAIIFHAHQKLDTVARRHLAKILPKDAFFPSNKQIRHFEGSNGPDGAKLKRQSEGEQPWHFVNPFDENDTELHTDISYHYMALVDALIQKDEVQASFQAAWLAHALVDGLTPAHHYPYEDELSRLRGGEERHTRKGLVGRVYVKSNTVRESALASMKLVGPKGLLTNHAMFEAGAYAIIAPLKISKGKPNQEQMENIVKNGVVATFKQTAREIAELGLYHRFMAGGWTLSLNKSIRKELAPRMVRMITLAWYAATVEASQAK